ncbi:MAG TPA: aconitase family protein [Planctomycetaceae bacterium]|nr:aconitase family protein [Planctomycetaceae bacterium]
MPTDTVARPFADSLAEEMMTAIERNCREFGNISLGIGTSQIAYVLATQTLPLNRPQVRRIEVNGELAPGVLNCHA